MKREEEKEGRRGRRRGREREGEEGGGMKGEWKTKGVKGEAEGNEGGKNYEHKLGSHARLDLWYQLRNGYCPQLCTHSTKV